MAAERRTARFLTPGVALTALVLVGFLAYALLAQLARTPRIFYDELFYTEAASSLAHGTGLSFRGEPYDFGVLYPVFLAPIHWLAADREAVYSSAKALNALFFALTAIPVYLLARRLLQPWASVGVAAVALLVPSSVYVAVVMTESLAYLTSAWAIYAIVLAVERPTLARQVAALSSIAVATLNRPQFLVLYLAYLLALVLGVLLLPQRRERVRASMMRLWPTGLTVAIGLVGFVALPFFRGATPQESLGRYDVLWRSYDLTKVGKWLVYHLADLDVYLAVVPFAVAPIVLAAFVVRTRAGSERFGAFLATFVAANVLTLVLVAFVVTYQETSGAGDHRIHDRYLFYLVPLWLVVLFAWFERGAPRPPVAAAAGAVVAVLLPALLPIHDLDVNDGTKVFNAVATALPAAVATAVDPTFAVGRIVLSLVALALVIAAFLLPRRREDVALGALIWIFLLNSTIAWAHAFEPNEAKVFAGSGLERRWVDERVSQDSEVTLLPAECTSSTLPRDSFFLTEFFNATVEDVVDVGGEFQDATVGRDGSVVMNSGELLDADYVVAQPGVRVRGQRLAEGTNARLVLWDTSGPVRVDGVASTAELVRAACRESTLP